MTFFSIFYPAYLERVGTEEIIGKGVLVLKLSYVYIAIS